MLLTVLRARNYGAKKDRVKALKLKAAMKNPDEFYFAMHRKKTTEGVHVLDGAESLPHDVVQVRSEGWQGGARKWGDTAGEQIVYGVQVPLSYS